MPAPREMLHSEPMGTIVEDVGKTLRPMGYGLSHDEIHDVAETAIETWLDVRGLANLPILDGVGLVAMDREAGAKLLYRDMHASDAPPWDCLSEKVHDDWMRWCGLVLAACIPGIIVPDEVVEIDEPLWPVSIPTKDGPTRLSNGDTIAITRKSTLQPPVNEEE